MKIRVIGAHLPRLDQSGIAGFIAADVASFKQTLLDLIAQGRSRWTPEEVEERALELPEELNADLQHCALFEVEVTGNDRKFDPSEFTNPKTDQCGWEPVFLGLDGESVITDAYSVPPEITDFRSAFYIHEWEEPGVLTGPTGVLLLPPFTPVPPRLWRLAPYSCVD
jgi:hypothetical protein